MFGRGERERVDPQAALATAEAAPDEKGAGKMSMRFPESGMEGVIASVVRDMFTDFREDWSRHTTHGDIESGERMEGTIMLYGRFLCGVVRASNENLADDAKGKLMALSVEKDDTEFAGDAMEVIGELIVRSGLLGRSKKGTSFESGDGWGKYMGLPGGSPEP